MKCAEIKNQKSELRLSFLNPYLKLIYLVPIHMHSVNKSETYLSVFRTNKNSAVQNPHTAALLLTGTICFTNITVVCRY